jgi:hypothetical protein
MQSLMLGTPCIIIITYVHISFNFFFFLSLSEDEVRMWVFEEILPTGRKLSESINEQNVRISSSTLPYLVSR